MRIALVTREYPPETYSGGVGTYYSNLSRALLEEGHEVMVVSEGASRHYDDDGVHVVRVQPTTPVRGERWVSPELLRDLAYRREVDKALQGLHPSVVLTPEGFADCAWYLARPRSRRAPVVVRFHGGVWHLNPLNHLAPGHLGGRLQVPLEHWVVRRAERLCSPSHAMVERARKAFRLGSRPIHVIRTPVDMVLFRPTLAEVDQRLVLYAGRLEWGKGCHILAQAVRPVLQEIPDARFRFVGRDTKMTPDGTSMQQSLEKLLRTDGVLQAVTFAGYRPHDTLPSEYGAAALCVVPSLWENYANVCLEVMACGRPIVASRTGGLVEMIEHGKTGVLVPPDDSRTLAAEIVRLLRNPAERETLGHAARSAMATYVTSKDIARQMVTLLESAMTGRRG